MNTRFYRAMGIIVFLVFLNTGLAFTQGQSDNVIKGPQIKSSSPETEIQWIWGEVTNVDPVNSLISVKYLDYENDTEKEISLAVNEKTTYENIKSLSEIKPHDNLSIDYVIGPEARSLATNISLEKPDNPVDMQETNMLNEATKEQGAEQKIPAPADAGESNTH